MFDFEEYIFIKNAQFRESLGILSITLLLLGSILNVDIRLFYFFIGMATFNIFSLINERYLLYKTEKK